MVRDARVPFPFVKGTTGTVSGGHCLQLFGYALRIGDVCEDKSRHKCWTHCTWSCETKTTGPSFLTWTGHSSQLILNPDGVNGCCTVRRLTKESPCGSATIVFTVVDPISTKAMGLFTLRDLTYRSLNRLEATAIILHLDASDRA